MPNALLSTKDTVMNKGDKNPCLRKAYILIQGMENKQDAQKKYIIIDGYQCEGGKIRMGLEPGTQNVQNRCWLLF